MFYVLTVFIPSDKEIPNLIVKLEQNNIDVPQTAGEEERCYDAMKVNEQGRDHVKRAPYKSN